MEERNWKDFRSTVKEISFCCSLLATQTNYSVKLLRWMNGHHFSRKITTKHFATEGKNCRRYETERINNSCSIASLLQLQSIAPEQHWLIMRNQKLCKIPPSLISLRELKKFICDGRKSLEKAENKLESFKLAPAVFKEDEKVLRDSDTLATFHVYLDEEIWNCKHETSLLANSKREMKSKQTLRGEGREEVFDCSSMMKRSTSYI